VQLGERKQVDGGLVYQTYDAGHMLGSTAMVLEAEGVRLAFSGDVGRKHLPIIRDPQPLPPVDYLIMESTYGDRFHKPTTDVLQKLADVVNRAANRIPSIPIFVDSPLAINATEVFRKHPECYDEEARKFLTDGEDPLGFRHLTYVRDVNESKKLNDLRGPCVIVSASGMCEAGRILHHLRNNIEDPRNTVLITGFQAEYTLGRKILEGQSEVPIFGEPMRLRAEVCSLEELSGHADQRELIEWMRPIAASSNGRRLKKVFLVHGEPAQGAALAEVIEREYGIEAIQPSRGDSFNLT
jgi:metallo-beta-lactamase family protein